MPDSDSGVLPPCRNFQRFRRIIKIVRNLPVHLHVIFLQTGDCVSVFRLQKNLYSVMFARVNLVMRLACRPGFRYLMTAYSNLNSRKAVALRNHRIDITDTPFKGISGRSDVQLFYFGIRQRSHRHQTYNKRKHDDDAQKFSLHFDSLLHKIIIHRWCRSSHTILKRVYAVRVK